jgi:hypothetical protein
MNWKLILQLSLFGLAMGLATVFFLTSNIEPILWIPIFLICAYIIAKQCPSRPFVHGLLLGLMNSVWITASHILLFPQYIATHAREAEMMTRMPASISPRVLMSISGPFVGLISGCVIGLLAFVIAKILKPRPADQKTT